ncbi:hypothetical protein K7432_008023 [Basidiobolus ranarum]|uniref:Uncharacterized protein n=1 Tax=Basidiobolus ranarum TaxID=34480 RepID=A0ABR2WSG1_9FUNG
MSNISTAAQNLTGDIEKRIGKVLHKESLIRKGENKKIDAHEQKNIRDNSSISGVGNARSVKSTPSNDLDINDVRDTNTDVGKESAEQHILSQNYENVLN